MIEQAATSAILIRRIRHVGGRISAVAVCCLLTSAVLSPPAAQAVMLTNNDTTTYQVEVMAKSVRRQHELGPGKSLSGLCLDGCVIRLNGSADADYELEGSERVSIEGGLVYYDGEEVKPKSPDGAEASQGPDAPGVGGAEGTKQ